MSRGTFTGKCSLRRVGLALAVTLAVAGACPVWAGAADGAAQSAGQADADDLYYETLAAAYFDLDQYKQEGGGLISDNKLSKIYDEVEVAGKTLRLGMSYDEVVEILGVEAETPADFADQETKGLAVTGEFADADGNRVTIGFIGDGTVREGKLYSAGNITSSRRIAVAAAGLSAGSSLKDVVETLGQPTSIAVSSFSDYDEADGKLVNRKYLDLYYIFSDKEGSIGKIRILLDHEEVARLSLEGTLQ